MRPARYSLAAVRTQRDLARQSAQQDLVLAQVEVAKAHGEVDAARARLGEHDVRRTADLCARPILQSGAELARSGAYAARLGRERVGLQQQLSAALRSLAERERALRLAELTLREAHIQRELIERHYERFLAEQRKAADRAEELELEDLRRPTRSRILRD
jgi:hypothetical protein